MILIGSRAVIKGFAKTLSIPTPPFYRGDMYSDHDYIATKKEWDIFKSAFGDYAEDVPVDNKNVSAFRFDGKEVYEAYIVEQGSGSSDDWLMNYLGAYGDYVVVPLEVCLAIKMSHRFKKDSPFFLKTMAHIKFLQHHGVSVPEELDEFVKLRMKESMNYGHPKLNVSKKNFFDDTIYTYDHDSIHKTVALLSEPAYTHYIKDGEQVMTSKEKFFSVPEAVRLAGVYEETCVLALERSQIPNDFKIDPERSFMMALEKVCTSITSGWFRSFAYQNYEVIVKMYQHYGKDDYVKRFKDNFHLVEPFKNA